MDDRPFHASLRARGVDLHHPVWDDPEIDWAGFDAVLIRTTWDYQEKLPAFLQWADRVGAVTRLFNPPEVVRWNTRKTYLRELELRGIPIAPTLWLEPGARVDLPALLAERGWTRGFFKPVVGATARETLRFQADPEGLAAAAAHLERLLPQEGLMLQPYLPQVETEGEFSAIFLGGRLSHCVQKVPVPGDYRVQDDFGASDRPVSLPERELALARRVLSIVEGEFGPLLYARVDFLRDGERSYVNELEIVEPSLFFRHCPPAPDALADALLERLR